MPDSSPESLREIVERYFKSMRTGDPNIGDLLSEDIVWVAPESSPVGARHSGKKAVLELMGMGVSLYDMSQPMQMEFGAMAAEGEHVFVEMTLSARTASGEPYRNHYVFVFRIKEGLIVEVHEHLDTHYTQKMLFDPTGTRSPIDA